MSLARTFAFAVVNGIFWSVLIDEQPKAAILSVLAMLLWLITFDRPEDAT